LIIIKKELGWGEKMKIADKAVNVLTLSLLSVSDINILLEIRLSGAAERV